MIKAFVFDLDGTLLHTLPDMAKAANDALEHYGFPTHDLCEYEKYMGNGGWKMIHRAVPPNATPEQCGQVFDLWRELYMGSDYALTHPFPGIESVLRELLSRGEMIAVLSNKFDEGARYLVERHFPGMFQAVRGDKPPAPRKPDPTTLLDMLGFLGVAPDEVAYVGDAKVDVEVARNAGVMAVGVSWGYDGADPLPVGSVDAYIHDPSELIALL